ncbi:MAG: Glu/Leu/Phe/Val dehydrogenase [Verrucomicrobiae bacterium]|nr:Glu/Leu/Phe/Val dehydrogenase [Verrucomicrobiae bacterium]
MKLLDDPVYRMACQQFDRAADVLGMPEQFRERIKQPKRCISVSMPVLMDDGSVQVFWGHRVQHHLTLGPTKGGLRFSPQVELGEVAALAMWMSWKCALVGLPYGGGKGGVNCNPRELSLRELEMVTRRYTQEMMPFIGPQTDVMAPDMGTNEQTMAWMMDTYSMHAGHAVPAVVTGKPVSIGGSLGRREATGRGVAFLIGRVMEILQMEPQGTTAIIQGFGNVGSVAAYALRRFGIKIVGISDFSGALFHEKGLDLEKLEAHVLANRSLEGFSEGQWMSNEELLVQPCDILVPAAVERTITENNAHQLKCRILAEAANGPTTPEADGIIDEREDIFLIPDVLCNAGGVIVSYFEWVQDLQNFFWSEVEVLDRLYRVLEPALAAILKRAKERKISHRNAALCLGIERVMQAKQMRGLFP